MNPHFVILAILPWLLLLINPNWVFQGFGHMDPWYYFGLSIDFPRYQHLFWLYPAERLTWILPARAFVALLSPVYGWLAFHFCVYWVSVFSLYFIVRRLLDAQTALLAAVLMGCHPLFIGSNGWTYVDSGSMAYLLLSFAALTDARRARRRSACLALGGFFWGATAYTYPLWWVLTPCCAFFYWGIAGEDSSHQRSVLAGARRYLAESAAFGLGIAAMTAVMMICHNLIHGSGGGFFYAANLAMVKFHATVKKEQVNWGSDSYVWLAQAGWIVFPVLVVIGAGLALLRHLLGKVRLARCSMGIALAYGYAFLALLYLQVRHTHALEFDYYVSILIPLEFLVLAVLVFERPPGLTQKVFYPVLVASAVISAAPLMKVDLYRILNERTLALHYGVGLGAIAAGLLSRQNSRRWPLSVVGLAVAGFGLIPYYPNSAWASSMNGLSATQRVADAVRAIDRNIPEGKYPAFWIDDFHDPYTREYRAIMCAFESHSFSMWRYPAVEPGQRYQPGTELILVTRKKEIFDTSNASMTKVGMPLRLLNQHLISGEGDDPSDRVAYWLTFTEVLEVPHEDAAAPPGQELKVVPASVKLSSILPAGTTGVEVDPGPPVAVKTAPELWAYAAYAELPFTNEDWTPAQIRVSLRVIRGRMGIGVLNSNEKTFRTRVAVAASGAFQSVTLEIEHPEDSRKLIFLNEAPDGGKSEALVSEITVLAYPSSNLFKRSAPGARPEKARATAH